MRDFRLIVLLGRLKSILELSDSSALSSPSEPSPPPRKCRCTTLELVQTRECSARKERGLLALAPALRLLVATGEPWDGLRSDVAIGALDRQVTTDRATRDVLSVGGD